MSLTNKMDPAGRLSCREIFALLSQYLDRELSPELCDCLQKHIEDCPPCVEFLESLKKTVRLCQDLEPTHQPTPLPAALRQQLLAAYQKSQK